jgi:hypothetical protein
MPIRDEDGHRAMQAAGKAWKAIKTKAAWPPIANQAPHRHRQANSGTCRGREPPHARHTCLGQPTADQGCVLRHGVDLGIAIDFGGLLTVMPRSAGDACATPQRSALAMFLVERVSWHQRGLPRSHPSSLWRVAIDERGRGPSRTRRACALRAGCGRRPKSGRYRSVFATHG